LDIANLKQLKAEGRYYRIRTGDCRIGITIEDDLVTFVRVLHRKEIYRFFP
jgi:mRNA interferase RelE/StbE